MYEAVAAYPAGDSTVSRQAKTAADYGYDGVVVRTRTAEFDADAISDRYGIDVVGGIEIDAAGSRGCRRCGRQPSPGVSRAPRPWWH
ncbi:MAG: hypothetical protein J07HN4v3_00348 [Halonotius sp. J07HN4]|nr:MAG: hypothetical protein J07HN4v3_00348 [Halonotius sp. J07HN4]